MELYDLVTSEYWDHRESVGIILSINSQDELMNDVVTILWLNDNTVLEHTDDGTDLQPVSIENFFDVISALATYIAKNHS